VNRKYGSTSCMKNHLKLHKIFKPIKDDSEEYSSVNDPMKPASIEEPNCYVCNSVLDLQRYQLITLTGFTETPIYEILELFTGTKLTKHQRLDSSVCGQCFASLDKYDELQLQAQEIQAKLTSIFHDKHSTETIFIKQEPGLDIKEETQEFPVTEVDSDIESKEIQQEIFMFKDLSEREDSEDEEPLSAIKKKLERQERIFDCNDCERTFTDRKELFEHRKTHVHKQTKFDCDKCTKSFTKKVTLQIHLAADHASPDGLFDCPICFKCHKNKDCLRRHLYRHSNDSGFLCSLCGAIKLNKSDLDLHMMVHFDIRPFACDQPGCTKTFRNALKLKIHLRVHTGEKIFECSFCPGRKYAQKWGLDLHVKKHHRNEVPQPETCPICELKIPSKSKLKLHLAKVHHVAGIADETSSMES